MPSLQQDHCHLGSETVVITAGEVVGLKPGDNPHLWYSPDYVTRISREITRTLKELRPLAATYFDAQAQEFATALGPYHALIEEIKRRFAGTPIGATETVFVYMAEAMGLNLAHPPSSCRPLLKAQTRPCATWPCSTISFDKNRSRSSSITRRQ